MQTSDETPRELRRVINAIHDLSELEAQIPFCKTIDEVEEIRARTMGIQTYDRQQNDLGPALVTWARRVAVLCQLRITELQETAIAARAKRKKHAGEALTAHEEQTLERITAAGNSPSERVRQSERRAVNSMPKAELQKQLDSGVTDIRKLAHIARKRRAKQEPKGSPERRAKDLARYYRNKAEKQASESPAPKRSPKQKFDRYWTQEEKLLGQFFSSSDLPSIEGYWLKEFQSYRKDAEDGKREREIALAKLKPPPPRPAWIPASV